jgi:tripartite-type tricarboxylate transporter receptor subunit TctC
MLIWRAAPPSILKVLILATAILSPCCAHADDDYPTRPVKIITPFGAGGPTDVYIRAIARRA